MNTNINILMLDYENAFENINIHTMYTCIRSHDVESIDYLNRRKTTGRYNDTVTIKHIGFYEIGVQFKIDNRLDFSDYQDIPRICVYVDSTLTIHVQGYREYYDDPEITQLRHSPLPEDYKEYLHSLSLLLYYMYVHEHVKYRNA
jgi:hypothetical protein